MKRTIFIKQSKVPAEVKKALEAILTDLEKYGRTETSNGRAARFLAYRFRPYKKEGKIYIKWHPKQKKSVITLHKFASIEVVNPYKIKFKFKEEEVI